MGNISIKIGGCMQTERLIIKPTTTNDVDLLLKMDKQEITQKYLGGIKNKTREERIEFLKKKTNSYTVYLKDNTPIGFIGINKNNELGYIFDYDYCNKGYCTEACKELLNSVNLKEIYANIIKGNDSSKRVLEKLGFKKIKEDTEFIYYRR